MAVEKNTTQRVVLITGCSEPNSIGANLALDLLRRGWKVYATARKVETLAPLKAEGAQVLALDVVDKLSIADVKQTIFDAEGRLDALVNNAGVEDRCPVIDVDIERMRGMYEVNVFAPIALSQAFVPLLVKGHKLSGARSVIINIGSAAAYGNPWMGVYGSTKAALQSLSDAMRRELAPLGIASVTVELSVVDTAMQTGLKAFGLSNKGSQTGLYANFPEVEDAFKLEFKKMCANAPSVQEVANALGRAVETPPRKLWLGERNWLFRWIIPALPIAILDRALSQAQHVGLVRTSDSI